MLIECSRALFRQVGFATHAPVAAYAPRFCWVGTSFYDEDYDTCMILTNKETGFCVITKYTVTFQGFDTDVVLSAMREAFLAQGYEAETIEAYLSEGEDVRFVSGVDQSTLNRLNRWVKVLYDDETPLSELASTFSNKKVQINGKRIIPTEAMKEALAVGGKEILRMMQQVLNLKIVLRLTPEFKVYRSFEVPLTTTFRELHTIIQIAFNWDDMHLHQFKVGPYRLGPVSEEQDSMFSSFWDEEEELDETVYTLNHLSGGAKKFTYIYDFGDYWEHVIHIGKRELREGEPEVICTGGEGDSPWEDCGGAYGYAHMVEVLEDPEDEEYEGLREWTIDTFPREFNKDGINRLLKGLL